MVDSLNGHTVVINCLDALIGHLSDYRDVSHNCSNAHHCNADGVTALSTMLVAAVCRACLG